MTKDGKTADQVRAEAEGRVREQRIREKVLERRQWAEYQRTYERCLLIVETVWNERLTKAAAQQQALAEQMRDRTRGGYTVAGYEYRGEDAPIPVPLFTPRDRLEFLGLKTSQLMIGTERRGLTVTPEVKDAAELAQTENAPAREGPVEAASGADETQSDAPLALVPEASDYGEPVQEAPAPRV